MTNPRILIVEDEPISQLILQEILTQAEYQHSLAENAQQAWDALVTPQQDFDAILLDQNLPDMNGLALLKRIKSAAQLMHIPIIMQTAMTAPEDIKAGLEAGAYYYLTKPLDKTALLAIVSAAVQGYTTYRQLLQTAKQTVSVLSHLSQAQFVFQSPQEAHDISAFLANACPDGQKLILGLSELMLNAIEHGNLGISYAEKGQLLKAGLWHQEIKNRLSDPLNANKFARVNFERDTHHIQFAIVDQGQGFDWGPYLELNPNRAFDLHGRGIAMAKMLSFDSIEYQGNGNHVIARVRTFRHQS